MILFLYSDFGLQKSPWIESRLKLVLEDDSTG